MIFMAGGNAYTLAHEHKNGWNAEAFKERYSEVLERYDYILGDWGYNQLRLRGFYQTGHPKATKDTVISCLTDYLNEYCNFGCAYFVLAKLDAKSVPPGTPVLEQTVETSAGQDAGEADAQSAETAAAAAAPNGILMRWPLKERPGGPVRMPGAAAMARAAAEAERRSQQSQAGAKATESRPSYGGRQNSDGGSFGGKQGNRPSSGYGSDKRSFSGSSSGQDDKGKPNPGARGPKPQAFDRQGGGKPSKPGGWRQQQTDAPRPADARDMKESGGQRAEGDRNGSRWPGKNRRRNRFGGKPNRQDSSPQGGTPGNSGGE